MDIKSQKTQRTALENASREFGDSDAFTVNTLEAIYGQESSFGKNLRKKGIKGAAGHTHLEKATAEIYGGKISISNDYRFDVDDSLEITALHLVQINDHFNKITTIKGNIKTIPIFDINERKIFAIAAYNAGEKRIALAQIAAQNDGENPQKWDDVKNYLEDAGAGEEKVREIIGYVEKITKNEEEFAKKSPSDKTTKNKKPLKILSRTDGNGHWITKDGHPVLIGDKNA